METRRTAAIILYTKDGKILLQHRSPDAPRNPNNWGCFGGGIEEGETPEQTVRRECYEEIEYTLRNPRLIHEEAESGSPHTTEYTYAEEYDPSQSIKLREGQGYGWFTIQEAFELEISDYRREMLQKLPPLIFN